MEIIYCKVEQKRRKAQTSQKGSWKFHETKSTVAFPSSPSLLRNRLEEEILEGKIVYFIFDRYAKMVRFNPVDGLDF